MCLILFAWKVHPDYPLILAANRDEFYQRPTAPAQFWEEMPDVLAGRDLERGGTWLGITRQGRFAALTNYREPQKQPSPRSRGRLVSGFLQTDISPKHYLHHCQQQANTYNGFNLLAGVGENLYHYSNRSETYQPVAPGIHGLSNHLLDTPWPKVKLGTTRLTAILESQPLPTIETFMALLNDPSHAPDAELPRTGVPLEWERLLSALFIISPTYGTRGSTVLLISKNGEAAFHERIFVASGQAVATHSFSFELEN